MTPEQKFQQLFEEMYSLCGEQGWGDPFSYARSREIHLAGLLGHTVADDYSGADAFDEDGKPLEYKSTIAKNINGTYNGISVQDTWEEQLKYLNEEKICKYKNHYFARYDGAKICEVYKMECQKVIEGLLPNLKKQFDKARKGKDPRLGYTLNYKYIVANSIKII